MNLIRRSNRPARHLLVAAPLLLLLALAGCQTARMPVPDTLSAAPRMVVQGRQGLRINQRLRFGPFEAHEVSRSWTRGRGLQVLTVSENRRRQRYAFTLRESGQDHWRVECEVTLLTQGLEAGGVEITPINRSRLECQLQSLADPSERWNLELAERHERPLAGAVRGGGRALEVQGTNRLDHGYPTDRTTGYEIAERGRHLAAVEVINSGAVWLQPDLDPAQRSLLSAVAAAMLLLEDLRESLSGS